MGAGSSQPKAPTIVHRDPPPNAQALRGLTVNGSQGCQPGKCVLVVPQGVSSSTVKLSREYGSVSLKECQQLSEDSSAVRDRKMAFDEFKGNLVSGKYFRMQDNGYCSQLVFTDTDVRAATTIDEVPWSKAQIPSIRKLSASGGFSSSTKVFIRPDIPFQIEFGGKSTEVSVMTLYHPSPIRIENVQHDAVLTLGDPSTPSDLVVMIPLVGSLNSGASGQFVARIASYIPGILRPNATGQYESIDAPTGNDWSLSKVFPGSPENGKTVVDVGYFSWNASPPLQEYQYKYVNMPSPLSDHQFLGWKPAGALGPTYVMLKDPVPVNPFDLQTIKMLPVTPSEEAIPPPLMMSLVYQPPKSCSAGKETFVGSKVDKCDPFAALPPPTTIDADFVLNLIAGVLGTIAVFIGIYFALKYATKPEYGDKVKQWGEAFGRQLATVRGSVKKAAQSTSAAVQNTGKRISDTVYETKRSMRRKSAPSAIDAEIRRRNIIERANEKERAKRRATAQTAISAEIKKRDQEKARIDAEKRKAEQIQAFKDAEAAAAKKKAEEEEAERKKAAEEEAARDKARRKSLMTYRSPNATRRQKKSVPADKELPIHIKRAPRDETRRRIPPPVVPPSQAAAQARKSPAGTGLLSNEQLERNNKQAVVDARITSAKQKVKEIQAKVEERKKVEEKVEQETKERIATAKKRIAEITDATRKRKQQEELADLEEKRKKIEEDVRIAKEQAARDLADAQAKLRIANERVRRQWKKGGRKHRSKLPG